MDAVPLKLFEPLVATLRGLCDPPTARPIDPSATNATTSPTTVLMAHTRRWKRDGRFFDLLAKHLDVAKVHETVTRAHGSPAAAGGDDGDQGQDERPQGEEAKEGAAGGGAGRRTVTRVYRIRSKNFQTKNQD